MKVTMMCSNAFIERIANLFKLAVAEFGGAITAFESKVAVSCFLMDIKISDSDFVQVV